MDDEDDNNISNSFYIAYPGSDLWKCKTCSLTGDIYFMKSHDCSRGRKQLRKQTRSKQHYDDDNNGNYYLILGKVAHKFA